MKPNQPRVRYALALLVGSFIASSPLLADADGKSEHANHRRNTEVTSAEQYGHFDNQHRELARSYFAKEKHQGRCPPGLRKKHNGCNPPGQARRWQVGQPLQQDVGYYGLPADLTSLLGEPQSGYHYGIVDSDILLLMDGTEMVLDAITNLGR